MSREISILIDLDSQNPQAYTFCIFTEKCQKETNFNFIKFHCEQAILGNGLKIKFHIVEIQSNLL